MRWWLGNVSGDVASGTLTAELPGRAEFAAESRADTEFCALTPSNACNKPGLRREETRNCEFRPGPPHGRRGPTTCAMTRVWNRESSQALFTWVQHLNRCARRPPTEPVLKLESAV